MSYKETKLYSVLNNKCPHCHEGSYFSSDKLYSRHFAGMNDRCKICNEDFRKEPGYYFGATYVSYALTVGFGMALFLLCCVIFSMEVIPFLVLFSLLLLILLPVFYRFSRLIWINLFVKYVRE